MHDGQDLKHPLAGNRPTGKQTTNNKSRIDTKPLQNDTRGNLEQLLVEDNNTCN